MAPPVSLSKRRGREEGEEEKEKRIVKKTYPLPLVTLPPSLSIRSKDGASVKRSFVESCLVADLSVTEREREKEEDHGKIIRGIRKAARVGG